MCGIAGAVGVLPGTLPDQDRVRRMLGVLRHRGPDGEGLWTSADGRAVLGHRRLSVIDLATGAQPMTGGDSRCAITFNGEIYNYRELRSELEARGAPLRTKSDTEVLLRWYEIEGEACLARCNGMFAFAIWDGRTNRLVLARDRLGEKPLLVAEEGGVLYFASTIEAIRAAIPARRSIDLQAMDDFLNLGFVPAPRTIYEGVERLAAASVVTLSEGKRDVLRYWSASSARYDFSSNGTGRLDELDALLRHAVSIRLRSDVPLGVFLSGGIDSSLITAYASRELPGLRTYSIAFGEEDYDETIHAERVSRYLGTSHSAFHVREELIGLLPELVRHAGEPFADASVLPLWLLSREARSSVTVALGGDGGDEAFGGYPWYRTHRRLERGRGLVPRTLDAVAARALSGVAESRSGVRAAAGRMRRGLAIMAQPTPADRYAALRVHTAATDRRDWYSPRLREAQLSHATAQARISAAYANSEGDSLRRMRVADIEVQLADGLMPKSDMATMAYGLELRSPLLDHEVVAFGLSLPRSALEDRAGGKLPLRRLLQRRLPNSLSDRQKQGFVVPFGRWFRGGLRGRIETLAESEVLLQAGWFDVRGIRTLVRDHVDQRRDHTQRLFALVVLEEWLRQQ
jgi:asparagine synthase (glutamine-hydrolysing)